MSEEESANLRYQHNVYVYDALGNSGGDRLIKHIAQVAVYMDKYNPLTLLAPPYPRIHISQQRLYILLHKLGVRL